MLYQAVRHDGLNVLHPSDTFCQHDMTPPDAASFITCSRAARLVLRASFSCRMFSTCSWLTALCVAACSVATSQAGGSREVTRKERKIQKKRRDKTAVKLKKEQSLKRECNSSVRRLENTLCIKTDKTERSFFFFNLSVKVRKLRVHCRCFTQLWIHAEVGGVQAPTAILIFAVSVWMHACAVVPVCGVWMCTRACMRVTWSFRLCRASWCSRSLLCSCSLSSTVV